MDEYNKPMVLKDCKCELLCHEITACFQVANWVGKEILVCTTCLVKTTEENR